MINTKLRYETDEVAMEDGTFLCKPGISKMFTKGDVFPACPISHRATTWELVQ